MLFFCQGKAQHKFNVLILLLFLNHSKIQTLKKLLKQKLSHIKLSEVTGFFYISGVMKIDPHNFEKGFIMAKPIIVSTCIFFVLPFRRVYHDFLSAVVLNSTNRFSRKLSVSSKINLQGTNIEQPHFLLLLWYYSKLIPFTVSMIVGKLIITLKKVRYQ